VAPFVLHTQASLETSQSRSAKYPASFRKAGCSFTAPPASPTGNRWLGAPGRRLPALLCTPMAAGQDSSAATKLCTLSPTSPVRSQSSSAGSNRGCALLTCAIRTHSRTGDTTSQVDSSSPCPTLAMKQSQTARWQRRGFSICVAPPSARRVETARWRGSLSGHRSNKLFKK
jgi:hypothetical protein